MQQGTIGIVIRLGANGTWAEMQGRDTSHRAKLEMRAVSRGWDGGLGGQMEH